MTPRRAALIAKVGERRIARLRLHGHHRRASDKEDVIAQAERATADYWRGVLIRELREAEEVEDRLRNYVTFLESEIARQRTLIEAHQRVFGPVTEPPSWYRDPIEEEVQ